MNRFLCLACCAVIVAVSCSPSKSSEAAGSASPIQHKNVVMIIVDDLGWRDLGAYGSTFYETPNIDRLAKSGKRYTQFYSASPVCSPTRASLMTGKHPARLDLTNWIGGEQNGLLRQATYVRQLDHKEVTMGELFQTQGYATGYIGKWHLGKKEHLPNSQGFDWTFAVNEAGQPGAYFPPYENPRWKITNVPDLEGPSKRPYLTDRLTEAALTFIQEQNNDPFFLVLSHYAVHTPLQAEKDSIERYRSKAKNLAPPTEDHYEVEHKSETKLRQDHPTYAAMVESVDESVGKVLAKLESLNLSDNTVVVFVSDNGGLSTLRRRSSNQATSNSPLRSGKGWLYEGGIRIPLIIRNPASKLNGTEDNHIAMTTDLLPTVAKMAGIEHSQIAEIDGIDLTTEKSRQALHWHFPHYHGSGNRPGGAIREGDMKLIEWFEDGRTELYDLSSDIGERHDLSKTKAKESARLHQALKDWRLKIGANMPEKTK